MRNDIHLSGLCAIGQGKVVASPIDRNSYGQTAALAPRTLYGRCSGEFHAAMVWEAKRSARSIDIDMSLAEVSTPWRQKRFKVSARPRRFADDACARGSGPKPVQSNESRQGIVKSGEQKLVDIEVDSFDILQFLSDVKSDCASDIARRFIPLAPVTPDLASQAWVRALSEGIGTARGQGFGCAAG